MLHGRLQSINNKIISSVPRPCRHLADSDHPKTGWWISHARDKPDASKGQRSTDWLPLEGEVAAKGTDYHSGAGHYDVTTEQVAIELPPRLCVGEAPVEAATPFSA